MNYKVTHTTIYNYTDAVPLCHNEVHLTPRDHRRQTCLAHRLRVRPEPARVDTRVDAFGRALMTSASLVHSSISFGSQAWTFCRCSPSPAIPRRISSPAFR